VCQQQNRHSLAAVLLEKASTERIDSSIACDHYQRVTIATRRDPAPLSEAWAVMPSKATQELLEQMRVETIASANAMIESFQEITKRPREAAIEIPFISIDASLQQYLSTQQEQLRYQRQAQSAGSATYTLRLGTKIVGSLRIRAVLNNSTHVALEVAATVGKMEELPKLFTTGYLISLLWSFVEGTYKDQQRMRDMIKSTDALLAQTSSMVVLPPPKLDAPEPQRQVTNEPPSPDAPIEEWLEWQEAQIRRGRSARSVSFSRLSDLSKNKYSKSQFKHASSKRKRTKLEPL
jgi:hypothetical protein